MPSSAASPASFLLTNRGPIQEYRDWRIVLTLDRLGLGNIVDETLRAFAEQARAYCALVEAEEAVPAADAAGTPRRFACECVRHLSRLYQLALQLPDCGAAIEDTPGDELHVEPITHAMWDAVRASVALRLPADFYWTMMEPLEFETTTEPVVGSLADDLADTWRDLRAGVEAMSQDRPATALRHWRWTFANHWGAHAASAIQILHPVCFGVLADKRWGSGGGTPERTA